MTLNLMLVYGLLQPTQVRTQVGVGINAKKGRLLQRPGSYHLEILVAGH